MPFLVLAITFNLGGLMKKLVVGCLFLALFGLVGCNMGTDTREVLKQADTLYLVVKTIVTDPGVMPLLSRDTLEKLIILEVRYLEAKEIYLSGAAEGGTKAKIFAMAGKLVDIFEDLPYLEKYKDKISAARVAVKIIRIQLG